jgi:photosystem II stability/assembly factor-like uncharacterized protein
MAAPPAAPVEMTRDSDCPVGKCSKETPWYSPNSDHCHHGKHAEYYLYCPPAGSTHEAEAPKKHITLAPLAPSASASSKKHRPFDVPSQIDGKIMELKWLKSEKAIDEIGFLLSTKGTVYRTKDYGLNWTKIDPLKLVRRLVVHKAEPKEIFFMGAGELSWMSDDFGHSFKEVKLPVVDMKPHPINSGWIAALVRGKDSHTFSLHYSDDFGSSWRQIADGVHQVEWATKPELVKREKSLYVVSLLDGAPWLVRTTDFFDNQEKMLKNVVRVDKHEPFFYATVTQEKGKPLLMVSRDGKQFQAVDLSYIPYDQAFTILDTTPETVFLRLNDVGDIYESDTNGTRFTLSITGVPCYQQHYCDFHQVHGVDGVFISNKEDAVNLGPDGKPEIGTVISVDNGDTWHKIKAPQMDSNNRPIHCKSADSCHLHLHGFSTNLMGRMFSSPAATGLIIATGNVGSTLTRDGSDMSVYFSRDAGASWEEVVKGSHTYDVGDHGALMVMARNDIPTDHILYSWSEGLQWTEFQFTDEKMMVTDVITEENGFSQVFLVVGRQNNHGVIYQLDFGPVHERQCKAPNKAGMDGSDYELWTPADDLRSGECLIGQRVTYTRRRRNAECFNGPDYRRNETVVLCECRKEDYECDVGYVRRGSKHECQAVKDDVDVHQRTLDCSDNRKQYLKSHGYRKIPGDKCTGATEFDPVWALCPGHEGETIDNIPVESGSHRSAVSDIFHHIHRNIKDLHNKIHSYGYLNILGRKMPIAIVVMAGLALAAILSIMGIVYVRRRAGKGLQIRMFGMQFYVFPPKDEYWGLRKHRKHLESDDL